MEQIKKKHHFVWKEYLRSWTKQNDVINAYLKKQKKIAKTNLINVAQEKFFYSLDEFSDEEQIVLRKLTFYLSDNYTLSSNLSILSVFTLLTNVKRELSTRKINFQSEDFKPVKANIIENIHMDFEAYGRTILSVEEVEDLYFLKDKNSLLKTMIFLCFQYTRTKKMKKNFLNSYYSEPLITEKFFNPISLIFGTTMANKLTFEKNLRFNLLVNDSDIDFITSDQPIINLVKEQISGAVEDLEFFYPINP